MRRILTIEFNPCIPTIYNMNNIFLNKVENKKNKKTFQMRGFISMT